MKRVIRDGIRRIITIVIIIAMIVGNLRLENFSIQTKAEETTTIYFVDITDGGWTGNDNAVIELVDNTYGHVPYQMTTKDRKVWSVQVPESTYNVTFNRYDSSGITQWNSWSAGGRDGYNAYYVLGHEHGYWGNYSEVEEGFQVGDKIYLDFFEFQDWKQSLAQYFINFSGASKEENDGKDISLDEIDKSLYSPILLEEEIEDDVFTYIVTEAEARKTQLRFWRGDGTTLWNSSVTLNYSDYKKGNNCVKVQGWDNTGYVCPYEPRKKKTRIDSMELMVEGNQKENRKIVLDLEVVGEIEKLIKEDTKIHVKKLGIEEQSELEESEFFLYDETATAWNHREMIFRQAGTYTITAIVTDGEEEFISEKTINIVPDRKPMADFKFNQQDGSFTRNENGIAEICITDCSVAEVGDKIVKRIYEIYYDENNDGIFQSSELVDKKEGNELEQKLQLKPVGNYKVKLSVQEFFEDTIESLVDESVYLTGNTEDKASGTTQFTITNQAPYSNLEVEKSSVADIIFTVGTADKEILQQYIEESKTVEEYLENEGIESRVSTVSTSALTAKDTFAWKEFDHYNYNDSCIPKLEKRILYEENNIVMMGYSHKAMKDFLYVEDNDSSKKIFEFDLQKDKTNWHSMEGGGFLFNTIVSEEENYIQGYCILITQSGMKLVQINKTNLKKFRDGYYSQVHRAGKLLATFPIKNIYDEHHLKIVVEKNTITVYDGENTLINDYVLPDDGIEAYGYGPITSHGNHSCRQQSYFTFKNIVMQTIQGESLEDAINKHEWLSGTNHYVINLSQTSVPELSDTERISDVAAALIRNDVMFWGVGNSSTTEQYDLLVNSIDGKGNSIELQEDVAETGIKEIIKTIKEMIVADVRSKDYSIGDTLSTDDTVIYKGIYTDPEGDPEGKKEWTYVYDNSVFKENKEVQENRKTITAETPMTRFKESGAYEISLRVSDDPMAGNMALYPYVRWSETDSYIKLILSQHRPIANVTASVMQDKEDTNKCLVNVIYSAYDLDHSTDEKKGIRKEQFSYKKIYDTEWTEGKFPAKVPIGETYLVKYIVTDLEKTESRPAVCTVKTSEARTYQEPEDTISPEIEMSVSEKVVEVGDRIYIEAHATDDYGITEFEICVNGEKITETYGRFEYICAKEGELEITAKAVDICGNVATKEEKVEVMNHTDYAPPEINITSPSSGIITGKIDIIGSIVDNKELKSYIVTFKNAAKEEEEPVVLAEGTTEINNSLIVTFDTENLEHGVYEIKIKAFDSSDLESNCILFLTVEENKTYDCTPPQASISDIVLMESENVIDVIGTVADDNELKGYELFQYSVNEETGEKGEQSLVVEESTEIHEGVIGSISVENMESGTYGLILNAWDKNGNTSSYELNFEYQKQSETKKGEVEKHEDSVAPLVAVNVDSEITEQGLELALCGTISDENLEEYRVVTGRVNQDNLLEQEICIASGTKNIVEEKITDFTYEQFSAGLYRIVITAKDIAGNVRSVEQDITVTEKNTIEKGYEGETDKNNISMILSTTSAYVGEKIQVYVTYPSGASNISLKANGEVVELQGRMAEITSEEPGEVEIVFTVTVAGEEKQVMNSVRFLDGKDTTSPEAVINSPIPESSIKTQTSITGTAKDEEGIAYYVLEYRQDGASKYVELNRSTNPVENGVLGTIDTGALENGRYLIRLTVVDNGGNRVKTEQAVNVEGQLKMGNMYLSFADISGDVSGIPLTVTRSYDSRNKMCEDFGYGWRLGLQSVQIIEASDITQGYKMKKTGASFSTAYSLEQTKCHDVTVTYGDGTSDRFELKTSPSKQALVPIYQTKVTFQCVTNQKVTLELRGENTGIVQGDSLFLDEHSLTDNHSYVLTKEDGTKLYLDTQFGLRKMEDINGNIVTIGSNGFVHSNGTGISFQRDEAGKIVYAEEKNQNGIVVTSVKYAYDSCDNLISVTDEANRTVTYVYDEQHNLIEIIDPSGIAVARNEYDENGKLVATIDAQGNRTEYTYDIEGRTEAVRDRLGNVTVYTYDENGNVIQKVDALGNKTVNVFDKNNNLLSCTDALGNVTRYEYDENNNLLKKTGANGLEAKFVYHTNNLVSNISVLDVNKAKITYDKKGNIESVEDALGNSTTYEYEKDGKLKSISDEIGTYKTYTYDKNGNVISETDGNGNITQYTYDEKGYCNSKSEIVTTNSGLETITIKYVNDASGNIIQEISPEGEVTFYEYNESNQLTTTINSMNQKTMYVYDTKGNVKEIQHEDGTKEVYEYDAEGNTTKITDRNGRTSFMVYDKLGRMIELRSADGLKETYEYDAVGNVVKMISATGAVKKYEYDSLYRNTAVIDGLGNKITYEYDDYSQITKITDAKGNVFQYEYDKNGNKTKIIYPDGTEYKTKYNARNQVVSEIDAYGNETKSDYDGNGNLIQVTDALGGETQYEYDELGNLLKIVDANQNVTSYTYDNEGRIKSIKNPLGQESYYEYDKLGNIIRYTDNMGNQTQYAYDENQQLISETTKEGTVTYQYANVSQLISVEDGNGTTKYEYDTYGKLLSKKMPDNTCLEYSYDTYGRLQTKELKISGIEKNKTTYEYDALNRLTRVIDRNGNATVYEYDEIGNRTAVRYANGIVLTYTYDACSRLMEECVTDKDNVLLRKYKYAYGKNGEKKLVEEIAEGKTVVTEYAYDELEHLTREVIKDEAGCITNEYQYDKVGNRISKETKLEGNTEGLVDSEIESNVLAEGKTSYNYNACNQLIQEIQEQKEIAYEYDANGNLISQQCNSEEIQYRYNTKNQLVEVIQKENGTEQKIESYQYDYKGNRIEKDTSGKKIKYVIDESQSLSQIEAEITEEDCTVYTLGLERISMEKADGLWYYAYDGHGDVRALMDVTGNITDSYSYEAYGNLLRQQGETENSFFYTGEYLDELTGLYYLRARYMNPSTGTFTSLDTYSGTLDSPVTLHKYLYVHGNPVAYNDPTGHMAWAATSCIVGSEITASEIRHNSFVMAVGFAVLAKLMQVVATENAYNNTYYVMDGIVDNVNWLTQVAAVTNEEIRARVEEKVEAGTLARRKDGRRYTVYTLGKEIEKDVLEVRYVGRTKDYDERMKQHRRKGGVMSRFGLEPKDKYENLTYEVCRGLEQHLMAYYHTRSWLKENGVNKVNGISAKNKNAELYYGDTLTYFENQKDNEWLCIKEEMMYGNWWN